MEKTTRKKYTPEFKATVALEALKEQSTLAELAKKYDVTYVQKGVQLVTKVCYYLEFSYIYKHLIINKKALCLIAEGCTPSVHRTN